MGRFVRDRLPWPLVSRMLAGVLGGYVCANLVAIAAGELLPVARADAVSIGLQISFGLHALAVLWVFAVRDARRAWLGLLIPAGASALVIAWFALPGAGA